MRSLRSQIDGSGGEHASLNHWGLSFGLALLLGFGGLLVASDRPGARIVAMISGIALLYCGVMALMIPNHDRSWGIAGDTLATLGGLAYLATAYRERLGTRGRTTLPMSYNAAHTTVLAIALAVSGLLGDQGWAVSIGLVWLAHIGLDRMIGHGLKYPEGFKETHLGRV